MVIRVQVVDLHVSLIFLSMPDAPSTLHTCIYHCNVLMIALIRQIINSVLMDEYMVVLGAMLWLQFIWNHRTMIHDLTGFYFIYHGYLSHMKSSRTVLLMRFFFMYVCCGICLYLLFHWWICICTIFYVVFCLICCWVLSWFSLTSMNFYL